MPVRSALVVGAGIVGSAVAWELARRAIQVTVVDAREPGQGATQASAGMLAPYTEARATRVFEALCTEGLGVYDAFVRDLRAETAVPFEYARTGSVEVALEAADVGHLRSAMDRLARLDGVDARWLDPSSLSSEEPALSTAARGALVIPTQGFVAVPALTSALIDAARRRGALFRSGTPIVQVRRTGDGYSASGGGSTFTADVVIVCAGSWTGRLDLGREAPSVRPIRGQLLYLRPRTPLFSRILWGPRCYLVPWADGSVLVGATVEDVGFDEQTTASGVAALIAAAVELVPALGEAAVVSARAGLRPKTPDELPVLGPYPDEPGLLVATGHYRNGALLAPLTARMMADLVVDGRAHPSLTAFGPHR